MRRNIEIHKAVPNTGAMDFSCLLDAPAGKHGFVHVKDGHLCYEDGTRAKFIGFNFPARANMPDHETAERISVRLASMGVNVVRLHAVDVPPGEQGWSADPEFPLIDYPSGDSRHLNPDGLERFDYWVARLEEKGIYLHVDLLVGRIFTEGDELDYPAPLYATKSSSHLNETLISRQEEFASQYLCHVNPYTGRALIDDPAVMTIQITNEDSIFFDVEHRRSSPGVKYYREEMQKRFNQYLLARYGSRERLKEAWTWEGKCALGEDEDPEEQTVRCMEMGDYHQPMNDPAGEWTAENSPARYADFVEFGIQINRSFYGRLLVHVRGLGARVPLATSCLLTGAADIYSHMDGDVMENNAYFNHPAPGAEGEELFVPYLREYVTADPRLQTFPGLEPRSNLTVQASCAAVEGKPFLLTEWNEYGEFPFHSSAYMMTVAYACLNDWDALLLYCYHTCDDCTSEPADTITDIMDCYNDPSLILQFGMMASVFLRGYVKPAKNRFHLVYGRRDLLTQPPAHRMPHTVLPLIGNLRTVFLEHGDHYTGDADLAVGAGFLSGIDLTDARHAMVYEHVPWLDAFRKNRNIRSLRERYRDKGCHISEDGVCLGERYLLIPDMNVLRKGQDYSGFAYWFDRAAKAWGLFNAECGITGDGAIVSDTGELTFHPGAGYFTMDTDYCAFFTGHVRNGQEIILKDRIRAECRNGKMTLALLSLDGRKAESSSHLLLSALGESGLDETTYEEQEEGCTAVHMKGKLYLDTLEGVLTVNGCGDRSELWALDACGNRRYRIGPEKEETGEQGVRRFVMGETMAWGNYELILS